jgi:Flp pilus assembly protein CpaB
MPAPLAASARHARSLLRARLALARHRRLVVATLLGVAIATGVHAVRPGEGASSSVLVAGRDLPAGHRMVPGDLVSRRWATGALPDGLVTLPLGHVLLAPVRRGEMITDARLTGTAISDPDRAGGEAADRQPPDGLVAVTVRLTDAAATLVARAGDRVDVIAGAATDPLSGAGVGPPATSGSGAAATVIVREAVVMAVPPRASAPSASSGSGAHPSGLLGALGADGTDSSKRADGDAAADGGGPPAGVVVVAVTPSDALRLAAVAGVRTLSLARHAAAST